jgi:hypothetical protein
MELTGEKILGMSDDDFSKLPVPEVTKEAAPEAASAVTETETQQEEVKAEPTVTEPEVKEEQEQETKEEQPQEVKTEPTATTETPVEKSEEPSKTETQEEGKQTEEAPNYEELYKALLSPLKANGKEIEIKSHGELIQLAQMGANYTRKMQELAPQRKLLRMLENNQLLDESKLGFLIDVQNKNPEAIKKLLKEANIDPLDLDTSTDPQYKPGNHQVSDNEVVFHETLNGLQAHEEGQKTLQAIHSTWDQASKEMLWQNPEIMTIMHEQRAQGVYDKIAGEVNRLKTLGQIGSNIPFVQAYQQVGQQMAAAGQLDQVVEKKSEVPQTAAVPVAKKVATPKAQVANSEKAAAAAASPTTAKKAQELINPLAMKDDEFIKFMEGRL